MEKKIEIEKKYRVDSSDEETIKGYINKIIKELNLKNESVLFNDDNEILKYLQEHLKKVILFQDSSIVD